LPPNLIPAFTTSMPRGPLTVWWTDSTSRWARVTLASRNGQIVSEREARLPLTGGRARLMLRTTRPGVFELRVDGLQGEAMGTTRAGNELEVVAGDGYRERRPLDARPMSFEIPAAAGSTMIRIGLVKPASGETALQDLSWNWKPRP